MRLASVVLVMLGAAFAGCTTTPKVSDLTPIAPERQLAFQVPMPDAASIAVLRVKAYAGAGVNYHLLIDGTLAAKIGWGEHATFFVAPGERIIELHPPAAWMGGMAESVAVRVDAGGKYFYRIDMDIMGSRLLRTTAMSAAAQ